MTRFFPGKKEFHPSKGRACHFILQKKIKHFLSSMALMKGSLSIGLCGGHEETSSTEVRSADDGFGRGFGDDLLLIDDI